MNHLQPDSFEGLINLQELTLQNLQMTQFDFDIFAMHCPNVQKISIEDCSNLEYILGIHHDDGLLVLKDVNFSGNDLQKNITKQSFTKLNWIEYMKLNDNGIEVIEDGSFDPFLNTLRLLDLSNNRLKMLPDNIFGSNPRSSMAIKLDGNQWYCDCEHEPLHIQYVRVFTKQLLYQGIDCSAPPELNGRLLIFLRRLCKEAKKNAFANEKFQLNCSAQHDKLMLTRPTKFLEFKVKTLNKNLIISDFPSNFVALAMEDAWNDSRYQDVTHMNCISNNGDFEMDKYRLKLYMKPKRIYRICMLNKETMNILPLECISLNTMSDDIEPENAWLMKNDRKMVFIFMAVVAIAFYLLGAYLAMKYPHRLPWTKAGESSEEKKEEEDEEEECQESTRNGNEAALRAMSLERIRIFHSARSRKKSSK